MVSLWSFQTDPAFHGIICLILMQDTFVLLFLLEMDEVENHTLLLAWLKQRTDLKGTVRRAGVEEFQTLVLCIALYHLCLLAEL